MVFELFNRQLQKVIEDAAFIEAIKNTPDLVHIHNALVNLFDHYKKLQESYSKAS